MSKVLEATCEGGVVKVGTLTIEGAVIHSEGEGASQGVLIMEEAESHYLAKTTPDLKTTLGKLSDTLDELSTVLNKVATTFTSVGAGMTGPTTAPPPTLATDVASIVTSATQLTAIQTEIDELKEMLK